MISRSVDQLFKTKFTFKVSLENTDFQFWFGKDSRNVYIDGWKINKQKSILITTLYLYLKIKFQSFIFVFQD